MVLCPTLHHHEREVTLLDRLMHGTTDGAVLMLPEESNAELKVLRRKGYAFVIVDPRVTLDEGIPAVSAANASGARAATEHLLVARAPAHRRDHRAAAVPRQHRAPERLRRRARGGRRPARSRDHARVELRHRGRRQGRGPPARRGRPADRDLRLQRQHRDRRDARRAGARHPRAGGSLDRRLRRLRAVRDRLPRRSRPCASRWPRWAAWPSACCMRLLDNQRLEALHIELKTRLIVRESTARARS